MPSEHSLSGSQLWRRIPTVEQGQEHILRGGGRFNVGNGRSHEPLCTSTNLAAFKASHSIHHEEVEREDDGTIEWIPLAIGALSGVAAQIDAISVRFRRLKAKASGGSRAHAKVAAETLARLTSSVRDRISDMRIFYEQIFLDECGVLFERERLKLQRLLASSAIPNRTSAPTRDVHVSSASSSGDRSPRSNPTPVHLHPSPLRIPPARRARASSSAPATPAGRRRGPLGSLAATYMAPSQPPLLTQPPVGRYRPPSRTREEAAVAAPPNEQALHSSHGSEREDHQRRASKVGNAEEHLAEEQGGRLKEERGILETVHGWANGQRRSQQLTSNTIGIDDAGGPPRRRKQAFVSKVVELVVRLSPAEYEELMAQRRARGLA